MQELLHISENQIHPWSAVMASVFWWNSDLGEIQVWLWGAVRGHSFKTQLCASNFRGFFASFVSTKLKQGIVKIALHLQDF